MKTFIFTMLSTLFITACSTVYVTYHQSTEKGTNPPIVSGTRSFLPVPSPCVAFELPTLENLPEIDLERFKALGSQDKTAQIDLLVEHIQTLRLHMKHYRTILDEHYAQYQRLCPIEQK